MKHTIGYDEPTRAKLAAIGVKTTKGRNWSPWPGFIFIKAKDALKVFDSDIGTELCACHEEDIQSLMESREDVTTMIEQERVAVFGVVKSQKALAWLREHDARGMNA